jgi:tRNA U34 2-thiouridine synthase MnmA/TrmU
MRAELVISKKEQVTSKNKKLLITNYQLQFTNPVKFVAPGQSAVFYLPAIVPTEAGDTDTDKNGGYEMLGGGIIL